MSDSQEQGSASERNLQETRDELAQASIILNTAYDRLQDLNASLRTFTAQRDRPSSGHRPREQTISQNEDGMRPNHSAIVLSDSEEENEVEFEALRDTLPSWVLELNSRWGYQRARFHAAARRIVAAAAESENTHTSSSSPTLLTEESRSVYPPFRRRRPIPPAGSLSRDGSVTSTSNTTSSTRRSILEAHLRQVRRASSPGESSTTLGRRVSQRVAAAEIAGIGRQVSSASAGAAPDSIVRSTLPLGLDPRNSPSSPGYSVTIPRIESRAAAHLRHSLLPNPPSGIRSAGPRTGSTNGTYTRFNDRAEHRPGTARSNSLTALTRNTSTGNPTTAQQNNTPEPSFQAPLAPQVGPHSPFWEEDTMRFNFGDPLHTTYRIRRRLNSHGEEQVFNINWSNIMPDGERDEGLSDPAAWMRRPRRSLPSESRSSRGQAEANPEESGARNAQASHWGTDNPGSEGEPDGERDDVAAWMRWMRPPRRSLPSESRSTRAQANINSEGSSIRSVQATSTTETRSNNQEIVTRRRRGWARLDPDGDEISTEDEATLEQVRTELRLPRMRSWSRSLWDAGLVRLNTARDATTGSRNPGGHLEEKSTLTGQSGKNLNDILDRIFHLKDPECISPLPVHYPDERTQPQGSPYLREVRVTLDSCVTGR